MIDKYIKKQMNNMYTLSHRVWRIFTVFFLYTLTILPLSPETINRINSIVEKFPCHTGVAVYSLKDHKTVYSKNAHRIYAPASNEKLFLAAAAIDVLGLDYCFETTLFTDGTIKEDTLYGNLVLKGSGDPSLTEENIKDLIKALSEFHVKKIKGNFYIDYYDFDTIAFAPGTPYDTIGQSWVEPIGGLMINRKATLINPINRNEYIHYSRLEKIYYNIKPLIEEAMKDYGIKFHGTVLANHVFPKITPLVKHTSQPLSKLLKKLIKDSDNMYADCIFKKIGAVSSNEQATWENGAHAIKKFLSQKVSISIDEIRIIDGSGLSRYNLVSPAHIIKLLTWAYKNHCTDFLTLLPVAGIDGTLAKRMVDLKGNVKAKTGTMGAISSLSGYIEKNELCLAFSIINNNYISESMYNPSCKCEIEDAICRVLIKSCDNSTS